MFLLRFWCNDGKIIKHCASLRKELLYFMLKIHVDDQSVHSNAIVGCEYV